MGRVSEILERATIGDSAGDKVYLAKRLYLPEGICLRMPHEWGLNADGTSGNFREQRLQQGERARVSSPTRACIR
jgi:hypothetical protein